MNDEKKMRERSNSSSLKIIPREILSWNLPWLRIAFRQVIFPLIGPTRSKWFFFVSLSLSWAAAEMRRDNFCSSAMPLPFRQSTWTERRWEWPSRLRLEGENNPLTNNVEQRQIRRSLTSRWSSCLLFFPLILLVFVDMHQSHYSLCVFVIDRSRDLCQPIAVEKEIFSYRSHSVLFQLQWQWDQTLSSSATQSLRKENINRLSAPDLGECVRLK